MPNFAGLEVKKNELIRKALGGSLFVGDIGAGVISTLTGTDSSLAALPTSGGGYKDAGLLTDDGMRFTRNVEVEDVTSFGQYTPTRSDVSSDAETLQIDFQETSKQTIAMFTGAALSSLTPDATSGELKIIKPDRPNPRYYRMLSLAVDGPSDAEIYIAKYLPRAKIINYADQAFAKGAPIQWGVTVRAERDSGVGSAVVWFFGGPGWKALLTSMGFS